MERSVRVRLEAAIAGYRAHMAQASASTREFGREVAHVSRTSRQEMQTVGTVMAVTGAAIVGSLAMAGKASVDFESSFAGVRKTVNGSEAELAAISDGMREMARSIPTNVHELNAIGEAAGQLGIATPNILGFTRTMADLGETTNLSAEQAATSLARIANITQMSQGDFDRLGSTIVALGNNFATTEAEIVDMAQRIAGAGSQIGLAEADIVAIAASLSSVGIAAEAGGTAISKVMIDIASEVANGGDKLAMFAQVAGMSAGEFAIAWEQDASAALGAFVSGLGDMEASGGSTLQVLEQLEITEVRMRDALLRASGAGEMWADAGNVANDAWKENVALAQEAQQRYDTVAAKIDVARNSITDAAITIGDTFSPAIGGAADMVSGLAGTIADLPGPAAAAVTAVGGLGGAASLAAGGFLLAAPRIVDTRDALKTLSAQMPRTIGALRGVGTFLTGPWGVATATAVAAIGMFIKAKGEQRRRIEEVIATLDDETGALTENTDQWLINRLEQRRMFERARELGVTRGDLILAMKGEEEALKRVNRQLDQMKYSGSARDAAALQRALGGINGELMQGQEQWRENQIRAAEAKGEYLDMKHAMSTGMTELDAAIAVHMQDVADATGDAAGNAGDLAGELPGLAGGFGDVGEEAQTATEKIQGFNDKIAGLFDPVFGAADALQEVADAEQELADVMAGTVGTDGDFETQAEKAAAYEEALDRQVKAAMGADAALRILHAGIEDGTVDVDDATRMLEGWVTQGWLSRDAADAFLGKMGDLEGQLEGMTQREWNLRLVADTTGAEEDIRRLAAHLTAVTGVKYVHVQGSHSTVLPKGVLRDDMHGGGWVTGGTSSMALASDEVPKILQHGEFVVRKEAAGQFGSLLQAINAGRFHDGGPVGPPITFSPSTGTREGVSSGSGGATVHYDNRQEHKTLNYYGDNSPNGRLQALRLLDRVR